MEYVPIHLEVGISIQKQKRLSAADFLSGSQKPAAGPQVAFHDGILDLHPFVARPKMLHDGFMSVPHGQHESADPLADPIIELVFKKGAAADRRHGLRKIGHGAA
jgi:hypothetical protein